MYIGKIIECCNVVATVSYRLRDVCFEEYANITLADAEKVMAEGLFYCFD